jgi:hypothetical protein
MRTALRLALCATTFALSSVCAGHAQEVEIGASLVRDTQEEVERVVALFSDGAQAEIDQVNEEEHNPVACSVFNVAYVRGRELTR